MTRIVITGGPGAGKTALIELLRKSLPANVAFVPEAATIVFGGGFPRAAEPRVARGAQRAIFHVQRELEAIVDPEADFVICDRGTIDGLAYWMGDELQYCRELGVDRFAELRRYGAVIHLRTPTDDHGYNHFNPIRTETAAEAFAIDQRIERAWRDHPRRWFVEATNDFLAKATTAIALIEPLITARA